MAVFQAMVKLQLAYGYDHINFLEGQLITTNEPKLLNFLSNHRDFREITDEVLIKLAPPLHMIRQIDSPNMMRKEDMIKELRSYGISVDPYSFCNQLSNQLELARKIKKRNFLTVLNAQGQAVFIDRVNLPTPILTKNDETLSEPDDPKGDFYKIAEIVPESVQEKPKKEEKQMPKGIAMMTTGVYDENEINEGKSFVDFCAEYNNDNDKEFRAKIEKEKKIEELIFKEQPVIVEETIRTEITEIPKLVDDSEIKIDNFSFLLDISGGKFMLEEVEEEEKYDLRALKNFRTYNLDVAENFLRHHGIRAEYNENTGGKMIIVQKEVMKFIDNLEGKEREWQIICLNMLKRRYDEIINYRPNLRRTTSQSQRKQITKTIQYGMKPDYTPYKDGEQLLTYLKNVYQFLTLGLQIPETNEKIIEALVYHRRTSKMKFHERSLIKTEIINNSDDNKENGDV